MRTMRRMAIVLGLLAVLFRAAPGFAVIKVLESNLNTDGETRGLALRDYYVYLADGTQGLKIVNISNPRVFLLTGALAIPGSFIDQVAVDGETVLLTDTKQQQAHVVDVWDPMAPGLKASISTKEIPRAVAARDGTAYVVEYGDDPSAPNYFSGLEIFAYAKGIKSLKLLALPGVRDVALAPQALFTGGGSKLYAFTVSAAGQPLPPVVLLQPTVVLNFPAGEMIRSLALWEHYLFAFGDKQLYAMDITNAAQPVLLDQKPVAGDTQYRKVDAAVIEYKAGQTSDPFVYLLLTTLKGYGLYTFNKTTGKLEAFPFYSLKTKTLSYFIDVDQASEGKIKIYDSALSHYFHPGAYKGGTIGLGAIGAYGMGFVQLETPF